MRRNAVVVIGSALAWMAGLPEDDRRPAFALSSQAVANLCDKAAAKAAQTSGVPVRVLKAISRIESGRSVEGVLAPWPWTVNQAGAGSFFDSATEAMTHVSAALAQGQSNIDIGCFQINVHWHGAKFASLADMFDPEENALYAARFLLTLFDEFGSWEGAVGAYHSRHSGAAGAYLAKVAGVMGAPPHPAAEQRADRDNRYPLLRAGQPGSYGSLVSTFDHPALPLLQ
ncbi:lytic transglycosylase domain-containing protein [Pseudotabrizicola formosa]|uniref:lytic transglycosylase domain-containing protein n=1 Tax=Pseudotabrizicola formosa TaxID=2030009 RepID=UPI000CD049D4|nr:lytic transglycosylase domain-containing protein [Pseudotabrizicola formosa]